MSYIQPVSFHITCNQEHLLVFADGRYTHIG